MLLSFEDSKRHWCVSIRLLSQLKSLLLLVKLSGIAANLLNTSFLLTESQMSFIQANFPSRVFNNLICCVSTSEWEEMPLMEELTYPIQKHKRTWFFLPLHLQILSRVKRTVTRPHTVSRKIRPVRNNVETLLPQYNQSENKKQKIVHFVFE